MCKCTPEIRTPYCGKLDCTWPPLPVKTIDLSNDEIAMLKRVYWDTFPGPRGVDAMYRTPAMQLRQRADELERQERDNAMLRTLLERLKAL